MFMMMPFHGMLARKDAASGLFMSCSLSKDEIVTPPEEKKIRSVAATERIGAIDEVAPGNGFIDALLDEEKFGPKKVPRE